MHDEHVATKDGAWVSKLRSRVMGEVLPGEDGYDAERAGWNLLVEHRPKAIVVAACAEDVAAAVRFAGSAGPLPVAVQATGRGSRRA